MISSKFVSPDIIQIEVSSGVFTTIERGDPGFDAYATAASVYVPAVNAKLAGIEFEGVMISATAEDQNGLTAVLLAIQLQGAAFTGTRFNFENGSSLNITLENYQALIDAWVPFRQSFFTIA